MASFVKGFPPLVAILVFPYYLLLVVTLVCPYCQLLVAALDYRPLVAALAFLSWPCQRLGHFRHFVQETVWRNQCQRNPFAGRWDLQHSVIGASFGYGGLVVAQGYSDRTCCS